MSEFLNYYGLETLLEVLDPIEDIQPPKEIVNMIKNETYPYFLAAMSKAALQEKIHFTEKKQHVFTSEQRIKIIKGFNQIIDATHEQTKNAPKIKTSILTIPDDVWEPWILQKANNRHQEKPLWKKILQKPIELFVHAFFKGGKPNKLVLNLDISTDFTPGKPSGSLEVPLVDIKSGGKININLGLMARDELANKYERIGKLGTEMINIIWDEQILNTIEHELSHYVQQILGDIYKDKDYGEKFNKSTPSEFYPNINSMVNELRKEARMDSMDNIQLDFLKEFMEKSSFFKELALRADDSQSEEAVEEVHALIDLAKREFIKRIYNDPFLYERLPPQTEFEKIAYSINLHH
jgi:hypothetical protein